MTKEQALTRAAALCSGTERCEQEIRKKLSDWEVDEFTADEVLKFLRDQNFINDRRYAYAFTNDKIKFNKWGKQKVRFALIQKDITYQFIQNALDDFDDEVYLTIIAEEITKKRKDIERKQTDSYKIKAKIIFFAQSRGYETDIVLSLL